MITLNESPFVITALTSTASTVVKSSEQPVQYSYDRTGCLNDIDSSKELGVHDPWARLGQYGRLALWGFCSPDF